MSKHTPEFSRILDLNTLGNAIKDHKLIAKPAEKEALTKRFGILKIDLFEVIYTVEQIANKSFKIEGEIKAQAEQECVATRVAVEEAIKEAVDIVLRPKNLTSEPGDEIDVSALSTEEAEAIEIPSGGKIDMGEIFTQYLSLALNPYPRKENANFSHKEFEESSKSKPFDILKDLK